MFSFFSVMILHIIHHNTLTLNSRVNQYKKQLGKWGLDHKRIKDSEYQAMLNKKRKRKLEDPRKESAFRLRGAEIDSSKIARYKKRKKINEDNVASDVGKQWHHI